jgi:hypothetical protein
MLWKSGNYLNWIPQFHTTFNYTQFLAPFSPNFPRKAVLESSWIAANCNHQKTEVSIYLFNLFISSLFNDAVSSSYQTVSNDKMVHEWWIRKDVEGSDRGLI